MIATTYPHIKLFPVGFQIGKILGMKGFTSDGKGVFGMIPWMTPSENHWQILSRSMENPQPSDASKGFAPHFVYWRKLQVGTV